MNATERAALLRRTPILEEIDGGLDDRTLQILDRRHRTRSVHRRGWLVRRMLLAADAIGLLCSVFLAEWIITTHSSTGAVDARGEIFLFVITLPLWIVTAKLYGLYERDEERTDHSTTDDFTGVFHMVTVCTWVFSVGSYLTGLAHPTAPKLVLFWGVAVLLICLGRVAARAIARRSITYLQNTVIIGAGDVGQLIARKLLQHPEYGINLVGFVDDAPKERREDLGHLALLGSQDRLVSIIETLDVERVIIAFSNENHDDMLEVIRTLRDSEVQIDVVPRFFEAVGPAVHIHTVEGLPLVSLPPARISRSSRWIKRTIDIVGAILGLVATAPLFVYAAWRIRHESPGPVLFRQRRLGYEMREFTALKFRTMKVDTDQDAHRDYVKQIMSADAVPNGNGIYKLDRTDSVTHFGRS